MESLSSIIFVFSINKYMSHVTLQIYTLIDRIKKTIEDVQLTAIPMIRIISRIPHS